MGRASCYLYLVLLKFQHSFHKYLQSSCVCQGTSDGGEWLAIALRRTELN